MLFYRLFLGIEHIADMIRRAGKIGKFFQNNAGVFSTESRRPEKLL